jgi:hypothetical protein
MSWSDDEDDLFENGKLKKIHRKSRKDFDCVEESRAEIEEDDAEYKRKRAGKRSHRKKTHKDEFWEGGDRFQK